MAISDPIADMLTRIRNAVRNRAKTVNVLNSKVCRGIADVLKRRGLHRRASTSSTTAARA
jgi:small subunit ribosomal protein S8